MNRVRVIEFEDEEARERERRELLSRAKWLIYDFAAKENVPLFDVLNFKSTQEDGTKLMVATFEIKGESLFIRAESDKFAVLCNSEPVANSASVELGRDDVVEFLGCKYLVNIDGELTDAEAKKMLGGAVLGRNTMGLRKGLQVKDEQLQKLRHDRDECNQLLEVSKMKLRDAASKKQLMSAILQKREELKKQYLIAKQQVEEIESQELEVIIKENSAILDNFNEQISRIEKDMLTVNENLERREKIEAERKRSMMSATLEKEEEELRKKLEEIQKKKKYAV